MIGIMQRRHGVVHGLDDLLVLVRTRHREHARMCAANARFFDAETARDDHAAVGVHCFADGVEALLLC